MMARLAALRRQLLAALLWIEGFAALGLVGLEAGLGGAVQLASVRGRLALVVALAFGLRLALEATRDPRRLVRPGTLVALAAATGFAAVSLRVSAVVVLIHDLVALGRWLHRERLGRRVLLDVGHRPARSLVLSFLALIGFGTILLSFPAAAAGRAPVRLVDAFFTAVSATCVTGLATLDTATAWSPFGKGVILVLLQAGGLGIMAIGAAMTLALGRSLGEKERAGLRDAFDEADAEELRALLRSLVVSTFAIEGAGATLLFARLAGHVPLGQAAASSVFHAVSAFCNAGFSLYSNSLVRFAADPVVNVVIMALIVLGGLGFGVLVVLWRAARSRGRLRLPVHAKVVLVTTAGLIWLGALLYFFFEYDRSLAQLGLGGKILAAFFQSVTARTAGFNTVPLDSLHLLTVMVLIALMIVGASPGSTGGGVKTTTLAISILALRAYLTERSDVEVFGRRIPERQVIRALALIGGAALTFGVGFGALLVTERLSFHRLAFEAASALGTVGLSLGVTPQLSTPGRLIVAALMFIGRVGPLTAASAAALHLSPAARIRLPEGKVLVG